MLKLDVKVDDLQKALQAVSSTINDGIMFSFRGKKLLVKSCNDKVENNYMIILDKEVDEACFYVAANLNRYISGLSLKEEQYIKLDFDEAKVTVASKKTKAAFELINPENFVSLAEKVDASTKSLVFDSRHED